MSPAFETILVERFAEGFATLVFNRPDKLNALSIGLRREMAAAVNRLEARRNILTPQIARINATIAHYQSVPRVAGQVVRNSYGNGILFIIPIIYRAQIYHGLNRTFPHYLPCCACQCKCLHFLQRRRRDFQYRC